MAEVNVTQELLNELATATELILSQYKLGNSDLAESIEYVYKDNFFVLLANDYFQYVAYGRPKKARKVPVEDLIKWMKKKGISPRGGDYNSAAFMIQRSIYENGIKARPFVNPIVETTTEIISEDLANDLSEQIATEIANDLTMTIGNG
jgi:hypothetical protein